MFLSSGAGASKREALDEAGKVAVVKLASENKKVHLMVIKMCDEAEKDPVILEQRRLENTLLSKRSQPEPNIFKQIEPTNYPTSLLTSLIPAPTDHPHDIFSIFPDIYSFYHSLVSFGAKSGYQTSEQPSQAEDGIKSLKVSFGHIEAVGIALTSKDVV